MCGYGTVFRLRLRPEATEEQLRAHLERWQRDLGPRFPDSLTDLLLKVEGEERDYLVVHLFASRDAYAAMDGDATQDAWYRALVELLEADPTFTDVALAWSALPLGAI